jgi:hypothetical protein
MVHPFRESNLLIILSENLPAKDAKIFYQLLF